MKILICDIDIPQLMGNKIFDPQEAIKVSHTILPICWLYQKAKARGIEMMTPDVYLSAKQTAPAFLMTHLFTPYTRKLMAAGVKPLILTCQESPFIATRFFINLPQISREFSYSFVFSGMEKKLDKNTQYKPMYFPESFNINDIQSLPFSDKKFAVLMNSNKRVGDWKKTLVLKLLYGFEIKEIYEERYKVINFFAPKDALDLYGPGWNKGGKTAEETENIKKIYKGFAENKHQTLQGYRFVFTFENAIFPGYITEKIFDAMFAGCVPVYFGAPDISDYIPAKCFIDFRKFSSLDELNYSLKKMTEAEYNNYLQNIKEYLQSSSYQVFTQDYFASEILGIVEKQ